MLRTRVILILLFEVCFFNSYTKTITDTSIIRSYLEKAQDFFYTNSDSSFFYSKKALDGVQYITNPIIAAKIYKAHGFSFYLKTHYDSSAYYLKLAIKKTPKNESQFLAVLYTDYSSILIMDNKFDSAIFYNKKSFEINKKLMLKRELMRNYSNFGLAYKGLNAYDLSTQNIYKGLPLAKELHDTLSMIRLLHAIAINYVALKKPEMAITYDRKALDYALAIENYRRVSEIANTIANAYQDLNKDDLAMQNYQMAYVFAHKINYPTIEAAALVNLGNYYALNNKFDSSLYYLDKGKEISLKYNFTGTATAADVTYSKIFTEKKQYDKALKYLLNIVDNKTNAETSILNSAYLQLSKVYEMVGNFEKAYKYHLIYSERNDSAFNKQKSEEIANLRMQYELNEKQKQMDLKLQDEAARFKLIRNITIAGFLIALIIIVLIAISYRFRQRQKIFNLKNEINGYRQRLLSQQMNPHFIFNTLNSIQYFIYNNKKEESMDYVSQFAQLMRMNLYNSQNDIVVLKDEIEALKLYLELEKIRLDNKFDYKIEIDPAIDIESQLVPSFLIQPLVENSIKHGILKVDHKGNILTRIIRKNGNLVYNISDNGIGFEKSKNKKNEIKHTSFGMELTKKRVSLIGILNNKTTDFNYSDIIEDNGKCKGALVELVIPSTLRTG